MPRDLHREISKAARAENRTIADWVRLSCRLMLSKQTDTITALLAVQKDK